MKQANERSTSLETVSETPQVQRALYRLQQGKLNTAVTALGDAVLLQRNLPTAAKAFLSIADRARGQVLRLGLQDGTANLPAVRLPPDDRRLLCDADSHAPVVARRILRERMKEYEERLSLLSALIVCVKSAVLRAELERLVAEDEEDRAALYAMEKRLAHS